MSTPMVSIDPKKKDDAYYRYKMPAIICKVEGNGNGIKTVFPNIHDVCSAINRPESIMMKFFQFELGTQKTVSEKDDKFIVTGSRTQELMQEKVYSFITKFVLCQHCRNPETVCNVDSKGKKVTMKCGACGKETAISSGERCFALFADYYSKNKTSATTEAPKQQSTADVVDNSSAPVAQKPVKEKPTAETEEAAIVDERENPMDILARDLLSDPSNVEMHIRRAYELKTSYNLNEKFSVRLVFRAAVQTDEANFISRLQANSRLLARFSLVKELQNDTGMDPNVREEAQKREKSLQQALLAECELVANKKGCFKMPIMMKVLFEEGVLKEYAVEDWMKGKSSKAVAPENAAEMRRLSDPFLKWLQA